MSYAIAETSFLDIIVEQFGMLPEVGSADSYRTFCFHVKGVIAAACGIELLVIFVSALSTNKLIHSCELISAAPEYDPFANRPMRYFVHKEPCPSPGNSLLASFALFHAVCDMLTLAAVCAEKHKLVVTLLFLLLLSILVSVLFIISATIASLFLNSAFEGTFILFVAAQSVFRMYEFSCARRLYWYYQFISEQKDRPQSALLHEETEQFDLQSARDKTRCG